MKILYEDNEIMVLDKPSGVVVNRSVTHKGITTQDFVESHVELLDTDEESEFIARSGVVHRLDKDTSGILLVAKTPSSFYALQRQFKDRTVSKEYRAIVLGLVPAARFEVNAPLARSPKNHFTMAVVQDGREAYTTFEFIKKFKVKDADYSYISCFPRTGRTHQIRVHLASLNIPVACDELYCSKLQFSITQNAFTTMMLHALSIEFVHPVTKKQIKFTTDLPKEFTKYN